jgi:hypothetical protein
LMLKITKGDTNFLVTLRQAAIADAAPSLYPQLVVALQTIFEGVKKCYTLILSTM